MSTGEAPQKQELNDEQWMALHQEAGRQSHTEMLNALKPRIDRLQSLFAKYNSGEDTHGKIVEGEMLELLIAVDKYLIKHDEAWRRDLGVQERNISLGKG